MLYEPAVGVKQTNDGCASNTVYFLSTSIIIIYQQLSSET